MDPETLKHQLRSISMNKFPKSGTFRSWEIEQIDNPAMLSYLITIVSMLENNPTGETIFSIVLQMSAECGLRLPPQEIGP